MRLTTDTRIGRVGLPPAGPGQRDPRMRIRRRETYTRVVSLKRRWPFGAHLAFALHYISFIYLVTVVAGVSRPNGLSIDVAAIAGYAVILPYVILALKWVYGGSTRVIIWKGTALLLVTILLNDLANFLAIRLTLMVL